MLPQVKRLDAARRGARKGALAQPLGAKIKGGRKGGLRAQALHPELGPKNIRRWQELHPKLMHKNGRKNMAAMRSKYSSKLRKWCRKGGLIAGRKCGWQKTGLKCAHVRWHVNRKIVNPRCRFCSSN